MFGLTFAQELIAGLQLALHRIQAVVSLGQLHLERSDEVVFEIYQAASGTRHKRRRLGFRVDGAARRTQSFLIRMRAISD